MTDHIEYYAHSENENGEWHSLSKHLFQTSRFMESFACLDDYKPIFKITGLLHDFGKFQFAFQEYLKNKGKRGSVPHAAWGAGYARILKKHEPSLAIDGHHKGIPDLVDWRIDTDPYQHGEVSNFDDIIQVFTNDTGVSDADIRKPVDLKFTEKSHHEVFIRYLFSALTDADWLSAEEHFKKEKSDIRTSIALPIDVMLNKLDDEFSRKPKDGEINRLRNQARDEALQKTELPCGFYSLALPTGMGKTLTSLAWALRHARKNNLKRIIIVLPYINIIDQTAHILKNIFGEEWVLEHHSNYLEKYAEDKDERRFLIEERKKLACENWDYPIIITTTVQFFESLFSSSPYQCRKVHNIAESVVIFDEVQTLPKEVVEPTLQMLESVQSVMRASFLFCTATQPAFVKRPGFAGISKIVPLIENTARLYENTCRVEYRLLNDLNPLSYDELCRYIVQTRGSALIILNTRKTALELYQHIKNRGTWEKVYHLSTTMCSHHRKKVIQSISDDLKAERKILVVSTQLIEAGVDFDFPDVFRMIGPLEGVIQAAGRCNRENKLGRMGGKVYLFDLQDGGMPDKTYMACARYAEELIKRDVNQLYSHNIFQEYYADVIKLYVDPDKPRINEARLGFNFETVEGAYRIIDKATIDLFVYDYSNESRELLHSLADKKFLSRDDFRKMQAFKVPVYQGFIDANKDLCTAMPQGFTVWYGNYNDQIGIPVVPLEAD